jgi:hypothetical protein
VLKIPWLSQTLLSPPRQKRLPHIVKISCWVVKEVINE